METRYGYDGQYTNEYVKPISQVPVNDTQTINSPVKSNNESSLFISKDELLMLLRPRYSRVPEELKLFPCQIECYNKLISAYQTQYSMLNASPTRSGKTPTILAVCRFLNLIPFIVSPRATENDWEAELMKYGFNDYYFIGYEALAGKSLKLNHNYLVTNGNDYEATPVFKEIVDRGILLILDEVQYAKNEDTKNNKACHALSRAIIGSQRSRICVMSATPYDKIQFSKSILKLLGLVLYDKMYEYDNTRHEFIFENHGMHELIYHSDRIDVNKTNEILEELNNKKNKTTINNACHRIFTEVLLPAYVAKIIPSFPTNVHAFNGYFHVEPDSLRRIQDLEKQLTRVTGYDEKTNTVAEKIDFGQVIKVIHELEHVKTEILIRLTHGFMHRDANTKMILYVWHHDTANFLYEQLQMYNPCLINGKVSIDNRSESISLFQQPDTQCRLLIANPTAGGVGLALDDQDGNFPRVTLMIPMYHFNVMTQALARTRGMLTKSDSMAYIIYAQMQKLEQTIMDILLKKEAVTRSVVGEDSQIITPGKLPKYEEPTNK